jgi:hypothetical protein
VPTEKAKAPKFQSHELEGIKQRHCRYKLRKAKYRLRRKVKISRKDAQERSTKEALQNKRTHKSFLSIRQMIQQVCWQNIEHKWVKGEKEICPSVHTFGTMLCRK